MTARAASERFATTLRTASVETMKTSPRESRSTRFIGGEHLLWTAEFESDWHRPAGHRFRPNGDVLLTNGLSAATRLASLGMPEAAIPPDALMY